jgi:hypothetical protein
VGIHWDIPLNIDLNINNKKQYCKIGTVCVEGVLVEGGGWRKEIKVRVYENGLHSPMWNKAKKPLAIALNGVWRELRGRDNGGNVNNVQYKSNGNCHYKCLNIMNIF